VEVFANREQGKVDMRSFMKKGWETKGTPVGGSRASSEEKLMIGA